MLCFLQNDHRFVDDSEYARLIGRFSDGTVTKLLIVRQQMVIYEVKEL